MKSFKFTINGKNYSVDINQIEGEEVMLNVNGTPYTVTVDKEMKPKAAVAARPSTSAPAAKPASSESQPAAEAPKPTAAGAGSKVQTPLPGTIMDVLVSVGVNVKAGQTVVLLEAMKMENSIEADVDGTITAVNVRKGDSVLEGDTLVVIG